MEGETDCGDGSGVERKLIELLERSKDVTSSSNRPRGALSLAPVRMDDRRVLRGDVGLTNGEGPPMYNTLTRSTQINYLRRRLSGRRMSERVDDLNICDGSARCRGPLLIGQGDSKTRHSIPNEVRTPSQLHYFRQRAAGSRIPVAIRNITND